MRAVLLVVVFAALAGPVWGFAAERRLATAETLVGTWNGYWSTDDPASRGSMELVVARVPGRTSVVGQFTFVVGATTRSLRYEGEIDEGALEFPLVADGRIVLDPVADAVRPGTAARLRGSWIDERGALPAPRGMIDLRRVN